MNVVWRVLAAAEADRPTVGTISLTFCIEPECRVSNLVVASNSGNEALAEVARRTIEHTRIQLFLERRWHSFRMVTCPPIAGSPSTLNDDERARI